MDNKETGLIVVVCGVIFLLMGIVLFVDTALIAAGNILITVGFLLSFKTNLINILQPKNLQGLFVFIFGVALVFYKFIVFGFIFEICGFYILFYDRIPTFKSVIKSLLRKMIRNIY